MPTLPDRLYALLRWSERYTKTDMVYLFKGGSWLVIGQAGAMALSLATAIAFGHLAAQDTYGNFKYVLSLSGLFAAFSLTGIGTAITQSVARGNEGSFSQGMLLSLRFSFPVALLSLAGAAYYYLVEHNVFVGAALVVVAVFTPLMNAFSLFDAFLVGKREFARATLFNFLNAALPVLAVVLTLFLTHRAIVVVLVFFATNALSDLVFSVLARQRARNGRTDPELLSYSGHLSAMGILGAIADKVDSIAVFTLLGPINLAVYAYALAMPEQIKQLVKLATPLSMSRFADRSISDIRRTLWPRIAFLTVGLTVVLLVYIAAAPYLFHLLFPLYATAVGYSRWYAVSILLSAIVVPITSVFQAHKRTKELYLLTNGSSLVLIVALPVLAYFYGIWGAIAAQFIYRLTGTIGTVWLFLRCKES